MAIPDLIAYIRFFREVRNEATRLIASNPVIRYFTDNLNHLAYVCFELIVENGSSHPATIPSARVFFMEGEWHDALHRNPIANDWRFPSAAAPDSVCELPATIPPHEMRRIWIWVRVRAEDELFRRLLTAEHTLDEYESRMQTAQIQGTRRIDPSCTGTTEASIAGHPVEAVPDTPPDMELRIAFRVCGKDVFASVALQPDSFPL